jgi:hypothetical protein
MPKILSIRPLWGGGKRLAEFDLELNDGLRLYSLKLCRGDHGHNLVFAPQAGGKRTATFVGDFAAKIADLATAALNGGSVHAQHKNR